MSQPKPNASRSAAPVDPKLNRRLTAYVAAAGATAIGTLAATPAAEAKIVYTPANQVLNFSTNGQIPLDINGDGVPDIYFTGGATGYNGYVAAGPGAGNGIVGAPGSAAALAWGMRIGPKDQYEATPELMELQACKTFCTTQGPWAGKYNRFLGVKFAIGGKTHYGWVNVNMKKGTITGYAYETVSNQPILAGEKATPAEVGAPAKPLVPAKEPATLGLLAQGTPALALWRRENEPAA